MKLLENKEEVILAISESNIEKPHSLTSTNYHDSVVFECGCNENHRANDPSNHIFGIARPVKFCFVCKNQYVTFVQVKGIFNTKATTIWSCKEELFNEAIKTLGL